MFNVLLRMNRNNFTPYRARGIAGVLCLAWSWGLQTLFAQLTLAVSARGAGGSGFQVCAKLCWYAERVRSQPPFFPPLIQKTSAVQISSLSTSRLPCMAIPVAGGKSEGFYTTTNETPTGPTIPMGMMVGHQGWPSQGRIITLHPNRDDGPTPSQQLQTSLIVEELIFTGAGNWRRDPTPQPCTELTTAEKSPFYLAGCKRNKQL